MADRADVLIRNVLAGAVKVSRVLPGGGSDLTLTIGAGMEDQVHLPEPEVSLKIEAPEGMDTKECPFKVKSDVDLALSCSRSGAYWTAQIVANELPPDVPTTVNINLGEDET